MCPQVLANEINKCYCRGTPRILGEPFWLSHLLSAVFNKDVIAGSSCCKQRSCNIFEYGNHELEQSATEPYLISSRVPESTNTPTRPLCLSQHYIEHTVEQKNISPFPVYYHQSLYYWSLISALSCNCKMKTFIMSNMLSSTCVPDTVMPKSKKYKEKKRIQRNFTTAWNTITTSLLFLKRKYDFSPFLIWRLKLSK